LTDRRDMIYCLLKAAKGAGFPQETDFY